MDREQPHALAEWVARPLEWRVPEDGELGHDEALLTALGIGGSYDLAKTSDGYILWWAADPFTFQEGFATVAEAQAAAEDDWQRSISTAIQSPPKNCWVTPEAKAALEASGITAAWQPIEMAPKDGSEFIAGRPRKGGTLPLPYAVIASWSNRAQTWVRQASNWGSVEGEFTHWQPLPSAAGLP